MRKARQVISHKFDYGKQAVYFQALSQMLDSRFRTDALRQAHTHEQQSAPRM